MLQQMVEAADAFGDAGAFFAEVFGPFDFSGIEVPAPTETFRGEQTRFVGNKEVRLIEVGPAHTQGDVLVHVPKDRALYTGDILFIDGTPIVWEGPVSNWVAACDLIESLDLEFIIPGHGPLTDKAGVRAVRGLSHLPRARVPRAIRLRYVGRGRSTRYCPRTLRRLA